MTDFVVLIAVAVVVTVVSHRFRVPAVVGFLLTGVLIGPSAFALIRDVEQVELLAEIGVVALLFTTGLEVSLDRLKSLRRPFLLGGGLQTGLTIGIVLLLMMTLGRSWEEALFFGFIVALSSTAIVLKLLSARKENDTPHGWLAIGVLIFQDFLVVPMIVLAPILARRVDTSPLELILRFVGGLAVLGLAAVAARFLIPRILGMLARTAVREIFILGSLLLVLGMSLLTNSLGFSMALGAFLAGILLAGSDYSHQVFADVVPFRDLFSSVFFISVGMLLDLRMVAERPLEILAVALGIMVLKAVIVGAAALVLHYPFRTAIIAGVALAQIGEFSFVLLTVPGASDLLQPAEFQTIVAASVFTMIVTPLLLSFAPGLSLRLDALIPARSEGTGRDKSAHVIVVGYGVNGRNLTKVLREVGISHVVVEFSGERAAVARKDGVAVLYGDATRAEILEEAGAARAMVIVFGISDPVAVRRAVRFSRQINRDIHIIVRTRLVEEIEPLYTEGADEVVAEEFETSIEIFSRVLQRLHVPRNVIEAETRVLRGDSYEVLRAPRPSRHMSESVLDLLAAGATEVFLVRDSSSLVGRTMLDLALREQTGATIIAIVRGQKSFPSPGADFALAGGDNMIIMGGHAQVDHAFRYLEELERAA
ncbi:MAG: cation:proton antiporter [Thermoanaerobaculia bacterium]